MRRSVGCHGRGVCWEHTDNACRPGQQARQVSQRGLAPGQRPVWPPRATCMYVRVLGWQTSAHVEPSPVEVERRFVPCPCCKYRRPAPSPQSWLERAMAYRDVAHLSEGFPCSWKSGSLRAGPLKGASTMLNMYVQIKWARHPCFYSGGVRRSGPTCRVLLDDVQHEEDGEQQLLHRTQTRPPPGLRAPMLPVASIKLNWCMEEKNQTVTVYVIHMWSPARLLPKQFFSFFPPGSVSVPETSKVGPVVEGTMGGPHLKARRGTSYKACFDLVGKPRPVSG